MPSPAEKQEARLMFISGRGATEIAKTLGLTLRTVQRWFAEWRNGENPKQESETKSEIVQVEVIPSPPTHASSTRIQDQDWYKELEKMNAKHRIVHGRFQKIMLRGLEAFESMTPHEILENTRPLQILSLGCARHSDAETKTQLDGREDLITETQAFKLLEAKGYRVIDESAIKTMEAVE